MRLKEVSPPGWSGSVAAMKANHPDKFGTGKGKINPYALAWAQYNKGHKAHHKPEPKAEKRWKGRKDKYPSAYEPKKKAKDKPSVWGKVVKAARRFKRKVKAGVSNVFGRLAANYDQEGQPVTENTFRNLLQRVQRGASAADALDEITTAGSIATYDMGMATQPINVDKKRKRKVFAVGEDARAKQIQAGVTNLKQANPQQRRAMAVSLRKKMRGATTRHKMMVQQTLSDLGVGEALDESSNSFSHGSVRLTVKKIDGEWQVVWYENGKRDEGKTYFASDKDDAFDTFSQMKTDVQKAHYLHRGTGEWNATAHSGMDESYGKRKKHENVSAYLDTCPECGDKDIALNADGAYGCEGCGHSFPNTEGGTYEPVSETEKDDVNIWRGLLKIKSREKKLSKKKAKNCLTCGEPFPCRGELQGTHRFMKMESVREAWKTKSTPISNKSKKCDCGSGFMPGTLDQKHNRWACKDCYGKPSPKPKDEKKQESVTEAGAGVPEEIVNAVRKAVGRYAKAFPGKENADDVKALMKVADLLSQNKPKEAARAAIFLDSVVRDFIPERAYEYLDSPHLFKESLEEANSYACKHCGSHKRKLGEMGGVYTQQCGQCGSTGMRKKPAKKDESVHRVGPVFTSSDDEANDREDHDDFHRRNCECEESKHKRGCSGKAEHKVGTIYGTFHVCTTCKNSKCMQDDGNSSKGRHEDTNESRERSDEKKKTLAARRSMKASIKHDRTAPKCTKCGECIDCKLRPCRDGKEHTAPQTEADSLNGSYSVPTNQNFPDTDGYAKTFAKRAKASQKNMQDTSKMAQGGHLALAGMPEGVEETPETQEAPRLKQLPWFWLAQ